MADENNHIEGGFILLARKFFEGELWRDALLSRLFLYLLWRARFKAKPAVVRGITVQRGDVLDSCKALGDACRPARKRGRKHLGEGTDPWSPNRVWRMLRRLEADERIVLRDDAGAQCVHIFIRNYEQYQVAQRYRDAAADPNSPQAQDRRARKVKTRPHPQTPLEAVRKFYPRATSSTQISERAERLLISKDAPFLKSDPNCAVCRRQGVPATISANDDDGLYYVCNTCKKPIGK